MLKHFGTATSSPRHAFWVVACAGHGLQGRRGCRAPMPPAVGILTHSRAGLCSAGKRGSGRCSRAWPLPDPHASRVTGDPLLLLPSFFFLQCWGWQAGRRQSCPQLFAADRRAGRAGRACGKRGPALEHRGPCILLSVFNAAISTVWGFSSFSLSFFFYVFIYFLKKKERMEALLDARPSVGVFLIALS